MGRFRMLMAAAGRPRPALWLYTWREDGYAASDADALQVFYNAGLCESDMYMTEDEAKRVSQLPSFQGKTNLVAWDWTPLTSMHNTTLANVFRNCSSLAFTELPANLANEAINLVRTFENCTNIALTSLPAGFGAVATDAGYCFYTCRNLALTSLPAGFGAVATDITHVFDGCTNIALTSLPAGFGAVATNIRSAFYGCTNLALTSLPAGFGAVMGCNLSQVFYNCRNIALTSLPDGFGTNGNLDRAFYTCQKVTFNALPYSFGTGTNYNQTLRACSRITGAFALHNSNFGRNAAIFTRCFYGTGITAFTNGAFDFSSVNADTKITVTSAALEYMIPLTCTHAEFAENTLKYSVVSAIMGISNLDKESVLSFARCLYNFGADATGEKVWQVTNAQYDILLTEMYDSEMLYIEYIMQKGWDVVPPLTTFAEFEDIV